MKTKQNKKIFNKENSKLTSRRGIILHGIEAALSKNHV